MNRDTSTRRVSTCSSFGPNLEWQGLPELSGRDDHSYRARVWRIILWGLLLFWGGFAWLILR